MMTMTMKMTTVTVMMIVIKYHIGNNIIVTATGVRHA